MAEIVSIVYRPKDKEARKEWPFTRVPLDTALLVENYGIQDDVKGGHPKRQLNIMSREILDELAAEGFKTGPGEMGEQIVLGGLNVETLEPGTQIQLGDACIEIIEKRNGCDRFELAQKKARSLVKNRIGVMAVVVQSGAIRVGDPVSIVETNQQHV